MSMRLFPYYMAGIIIHYHLMYQMYMPYEIAINGKPSCLIWESFLP